MLRPHVEHEIHLIISLVVVVVVELLSTYCTKVTSDVPFAKALYVASVL